MTYSDNFKKLEAILYDESGSPRKEIPKDFLEEISDQVETIEEGFTLAFLCNNQELMADLIQSGAINLNFFETLIPPDKEVYYKLGELKGYINIMSRIVSHIIKRENALKKFDEIQNHVPYAKDIILLIGYSTINEEKIFEKQKGNDEEIKEVLDWIVFHSFVHRHHKTLSLSDSGCYVYAHYKENNKDKIFYQD